jgi:hypothetical protein
MRRIFSAKSESGYSCRTISVIGAPPSAVSAVRAR